MKICNAFIIALVIYMLPQDGIAQNYFGLGKMEDVKEIKRRRVILMLEEEDPKVVKKLSKDAKALQEYQEEIKRVNEILPRIVSQFWVFNETPIIKYQSEIEKLAREKNREYAILAFSRFKVSEWAGQGNSRYVMGSKLIATLFIDFIESYKNERPVYYQNLPNIFPTKGDFVLGIEMMQNFLNARLDGKKRGEIVDEVKENAQLLQSKTLLIDEEDLKSKLTQEDVQKAYPYHVKIVDYKTIENAILERDHRYAVVQIIPLMAGVEANAHVVMDASDGKSLGYYAPIQTTIGGKNTEARVTERHLRNYAKHSQKGK